MTSSIGRPAAMTAIGLGGGAGGSAGRLDILSSSRRTFSVFCVHRGKAGHGPPVELLSLRLDVTPGECRRG